MRWKEEAGGERLKDMATANQRKDPKGTGHLRRITLKSRTEGNCHTGEIGKEMLAHLLCSPGRENNLQ